MFEGMPKVLGKEAAHKLSCSPLDRAMCPLRMWLSTSPGRSGGSLRRLRNACTMMSCWRTLHS